MARQRWIGIVLFLAPGSALSLVLRPLRPSRRRPGPNSQAVQGAKTIIDLQPFRKTSAIRIRDDRGAEGLATLINLNPGIDAWYLLRLTWDKGAGADDYHLENAAPGTRDLLLDSGYPSGIILAEGQKRSACELWKTASRNALKDAVASGAAYAPLCGGRIYLRNPAKGYRTAIESAAEFLRDEIPAGEKIVTFVRDKFFVETYREEAKTAEEPKPSPEDRPKIRPGNGPAAARLDPRQADRIIASSHLGIDVQGSTTRGMVPGSWYPVKEGPGIYVSLIAAGMIAPEILGSYRNGRERSWMPRRRIPSYTQSHSIWINSKSSLPGERIIRGSTGPTTCSTG